MTPGAHILALDLEVDPGGQSPGGPNPLGKTEIRNPVRSRIRMASLLLLDRNAGEAELNTFEGEERSVISSLSGSFSRWPDATIVTFNGMSFDIPILRGRALVNHVFDRGLADLERRRHIDVRHAFPGKGSLAMISDLLGLDIDERTLSRRRKCEADVVRTVLVWMHLEAARTGRQEVLLCGWKLLARTLDGARYSHLSALFDGL